MESCEADDGSRGSFAAGAFCRTCTRLQAQSRDRQLLESATVPCSRRQPKPTTLPLPAPPGRQAQAFTRQLLESVAFMHELQLVHTDLKPGTCVATV